MFIHICTCTYVYIYIYIYIHMCIYTCVRALFHTPSLPPSLTLFLSIHLSCSLLLSLALCCSLLLSLALSLSTSLPLRLLPSLFPFSSPPFTPLPSFSPFASPYPSLGIGRGHRTLVFTQRLIFPQRELFLAKKNLSLPVLGEGEAEGLLYSLRELFL